MKIPVTEFDIVFLSYDEPRADEMFHWLTKISPNPPKRVHGVKGFDAAHKAAANMAETERFITIDGDNFVRDSFFGTSINSENPKDVVYSYNALNKTNGLVYGNGSIKIWPRDLVLNVDTHEAINGNDFCWTYRYWQVDFIGSDVYPSQTPKHAFRSAYREGIKLSLIKDVRVPDWAMARSLMYQPNFERLSIWATIGSHVENGMWSILGGLQALNDLWVIGMIDTSVISDYDWFERRWKYVEDWVRSMDSRPSLATAIDIHRQNLKEKLGLDLPNFDPDSSKFFASLYCNPSRPDGMMLPDMKAPEFLKTR